MNSSEDNLPKMSTGEVVNQLTTLYCKTIFENRPLSAVPSVMLWGPPGVGKSQAVHAMARRIEEQTGRTTVVKDVRLLLFNPIDLRGIPTANKDKTLAIWLKPKIFELDESDEKVNIIFMDEITAASTSVQSAALQITLDRAIGEHRLPNNCIVIAAGNRVKDSVAYKMPRALTNRMLNILVTNDYESWQEWAVSTGIHPKVISFLSFRRNSLMQEDTSSDEVAFPSPRTWEMVSNILKTVSDSVEEAFSLIAGLIGYGTAIEFLAWEEAYEELPSIEDIFQGKNPSIPSGTDCLYALTAAMSDYAIEHKDDMEAITNSIIYAQRMPPDFSAVLFQNYIHIEKGYRGKLMKIPEFREWMLKKGRYINGGT